MAVSYPESFGSTEALGKETRCSSGEGAGCLDQSLLFALITTFTAPCCAMHIHAAVQLGELTIIAASSRGHNNNPASIKNN